jgi:RNA polymerase sigma factor (sigma-70 family)
MESRKPDEGLIRQIERAAAKGARSVCRSRQVVTDAAARTIERWEEAVVKNKRIERLMAWAFRVGANAARRIAGRRPCKIAAAQTLDPTSAQSMPDDIGQQDVREVLRSQVLTHLESHRSRLRGRQHEVLVALHRAEGSIHQAAKALGMQRYNVKRALKSALRRLRSGDE